jgi:hypothetical protein
LEHHTGNDRWVIQVRLSINLFSGTHPLSF